MLSNYTWKRPKWHGCKSTDLQIVTSKQYSKTSTQWIGWKTQLENWRQGVFQPYVCSQLRRNDSLKDNKYTIVLQVSRMFSTWYPGQSYGKEFKNLSTNTWKQHWPSYTSKWKCRLMTHFSGEFMSTMDLKQGCPLSPTLFVCVLTSSPKKPQENMKTSRWTFHSIDSNLCTLWVLNFGIFISL